jgi:subtilisin family serine protease
LNGKDVGVAVIDTGVDVRRPLLAGRLKLKSDVTSVPYAAGIHGTLIAGIIADLAPRASLLSIQACLPHSLQAISARCSTVTLTKALDLALQKKARIINLSLGVPASRLVERLIRQGVNSGAVVIAAAGNGGVNANASFPASLDVVIAVTAVDVTQALYTFASHGPFVDLAAPGVDILSAAPGGRELLFSGTSAAAPHVSAVAALLLQKSRALTPAGAQQVLENAAQDLGPRGKDPAFGSGLVDAYRAMSQGR